jgi:antibiotic biosynthesis monooxygenase (ABM) superfamily enzyme
MTNRTPNPDQPQPGAGPTPDSNPGRVKPGPATKHQLAVMIWLAVFPTLTVLNLVLGNWLGTLNAVTRTFVLATMAVPIVIYGLMPQLHRLRAQLLTRLANPSW